MTLVINVVGGFSVIAFAWIRDGGNGTSGRSARNAGYRGPGYGGPVR